MYFSWKPARGVRHAWAWGSACLLVWLAAGTAGAGSVEDCRKLFLQGDYQGCIREAQQAVNRPTWDENWPALLAKAQLAVGKYPEAADTITAALQRYDSSVVLRLLACEIYDANGRLERSQAVLDELKDMLSSRLRSVRNPESLVALGRAGLLLNIEPKVVLVNFFDQARRLAPNSRDAWLATGELALEKHDFQLAASTLNEALKKFPGDPDLEFGLARAYAPNDAKRMGELLEQVLNFNTNHVPALLLYIDHLVDAEEYGEATNMLARVLGVNPWQPEAWAYRAVLAHLSSDTNAETAARETALKYWNTNPRVDHLIGHKLSQKYRFAEGSAHQRQALKFDANYLPARIQLAQDLLRLGRETEGWELAEDVHTRDGYDVAAYNLVTLRKSLATFRTLTNSDFIVRMATNEAALYGDRVLALLQSAKDFLGDKYGVQLDQPTTVEIFPEQKDFGVRTFGVAHNPGFLGVCFGHVITANSPAAMAGHPENWEGVLWHEFCHVITLTLTRNKMPRWLSEGISVYESRLRNPAWDAGLTPQYRSMILGGELAPVGELSSAFMKPGGVEHVQFAYFESSLVVECLVEKFGLPALKQILLDLGAGLPINEALSKDTEPMDKLEKDFAAFARERARGLAPGLDWTRADGEDADDESNTNLVRVFKSPRGRSHKPAAAPPAGVTNGAKRPGSTNYWELIEEARTALKEKQWTEARPPLNKVLEFFPTSHTALDLLADALHGAGETVEERAVLTRAAKLEADATETFLRLMELDGAVNDWAGVTENAERFLAVNPLVPQPYRELVRASEELKQPESGIRSCQRLLLLDPPDPADIHFRFARLLKQKGEAAAAKRQVLQALEEAPRFRDAQRLLLELQPDHAAGSAPGGQPPNPAAKP